MKVGTKSVLFGAHCFFIHPIFVFWAWWKLYGFSWNPLLWVAFFVHDLGYWGKPNMDGPEGESHVELGAKIMSIFDYRFLIKNIHKIYKRYPYYTRLKYKWVCSFRYFGLKDYYLIKRNTKQWSNFSKYHSRFYAKKDKMQPSKLCYADKLAIVLEPTWLYLPRVNWSGEILEYMTLSRIKEGNSPSKYANMQLSNNSQKEWILSVKQYLAKWIEEHKDGKEDTWTPENKKAINQEGVWQ